MARVWIVVSCLLLNVYMSHAHETPYVEQYFDQMIDHFTFNSDQYGGKNTFKQRYLYQDKWWDRGRGPIFFYTGNEGDIVEFWNNTGFMFDIAPQFNALVVFAEHRYYGKSLPFGSQSFTLSNVGGLTVEQALADYAVFVRLFQYTYNATSCPVVAFGGSYGGMLSAYMRFKYPNVVAGSIAASAPIYLIGGAVPRDFFFQDVTQDFRNAHPQCENKVRQAFIEMDILAAQGPTGLDKLSQAFRLCSPLKDVNSYRHLQGWIRNSFAYLTMFDYPYPTHFYGPLPKSPVNVACNYVVTAGDVIQGLAKAAGLYYGSPKCYDIMAEFVECADPTGCGTGPNSKAWDYQACTEMVMPAGTNNVTDMFPVLPLTLPQLKQYCKKTWNVQPNTEWMNINFWGKDIGSASNIVFSNGNLDPWHRGGVLKNISESVVAVMIEGGAHHLDLRGANVADPPSLKNARQLEVKHIKKWIQNWKSKKSIPTPNVSLL